MVARSSSLRSPRGPDLDPGNNDIMTYKLILICFHLSNLISCFLGPVLAPAPDLAVVEAEDVTSRMNPDLEAGPGPDPGDQDHKQ